MIPLMKYTFTNESETRQALAAFVLDAPQLSMGRKCLEFEVAFAKHQERDEAVLFNSGGSANLAMLQALKNLGLLAEGDRVGFSALTWSTNTMPILQVGAVPVAIDCQPTTLNAMSRTLVERLQTTPLRAFFLTNAMGLAGDLDNIRQVCREREIVLLEDNCEALGTRLPAGRTGNFGLAASFSFFVAHHMSTIEGGMVCTDDPAMAEMLRIVRANGWDRNLTPAQQARWRARYEVASEFEAKYTFYDLGFNLRPTEITGFLGLEQLRYLQANTVRREQIFHDLTAVLERNPDFIPLEYRHLSVLSSFAFVVLCKTPQLKARYAERFARAGVELRPVIAGNMQRQPFYAKYVNQFFELPGADLVHDHGFYFANYPELTDEDLAILRRCLAGD